MGVVSHGNSCGDLDDHTSCIFAHRHPFCQPSREFWSAYYGGVRLASSYSIAASSDWPRYFVMEYGSASRLVGKQAMILFRKLTCVPQEAKETCGPMTCCLHGNVLHTVAMLMQTACLWLKSFVCVDCFIFLSLFYFSSFLKTSFLYRCGG